MASVGEIKFIINSYLVVSEGQYSTGTEDRLGAHLRRPGARLADGVSAGEGGERA